jgi:NAD(P)-dependent dehydrogenase (short-subunit alcohol dehydrogenase family)
MKDLAGKVAVVTGAGAGIGRATALALAREGVTIAACDIDESAAKETTEAAVAAGGPGATTHGVDVASEVAMRSLVDAVLAEHGAVDIVMNNAGIVPAFVPSAQLDLGRFRKVMDVNFWGTVYGSLFFLPHLLQRPAANLVNVVSHAGIMGYARMAPYVSSKFAVRGFSEALRMELRSSPVRVTVVFPGATKTQILAHSPVMEAGESEALQALVEKGFRKQPEAVARAVVDAIRKDKPRALVGPDTAVMDVVARLLPGAHSRLLAKGMDKFIQKATNG